VDFATIIGLGATAAIMIWGMNLSGGGNMAMFYDFPSIVIVVFGSITAVMVKYGFMQYLTCMKVALKSFMFKLPDPLTLITEIVGLADEARKGGLLSLEGKEVSNDFLKRGIQLLVDGHEPDVVKGILSRDRNKAEERHKVGASIFSSLADMGPAMGMIGTLIGLVAMLANMSDPKAIGPAMAVALLTTLYGAFIANCLCIPMADKLKLRAAEEVLVKTLIIDGLIAIQNGLNPRVIDGMLKAYLPEKLRGSDAA
jgi:chemotaxis protein MotA